MALVTFARQGDPPWLAPNTCCFCMAALADKGTVLQLAVRLLRLYAKAAQCLAIHLHASCKELPAQQGAKAGPSSMEPAPSSSLKHQGARTGRADVRTPASVQHQAGSSLLEPSTSGRGGGDDSSSSSSEESDAPPTRHVETGPTHMPAAGKCWLLCSWLWVHEPEELSGNEEELSTHQQWWLQVLQQGASQMPRACRAQTSMSQRTCQSWAAWRAHQCSR